MFWTLTEGRQRTHQQMEAGWLVAPKGIEDKQLLLIIEVTIDSSWCDFFYEELFIWGAVYFFSWVQVILQSIHHYRSSSSPLSCLAPLCSEPHVFHLISSGCWLNQPAGNQHHCSHSRTSADPQVLCTCRLMELVQSCWLGLCSCFGIVDCKWLQESIQWANRRSDCENNLFFLHAPTCTSSH